MKEKEIKFLNKELKISVFCLNEDLCNLIKKFFHKSDYFCICIKLGIDSFKISTDIDKDKIPDCIIVDDNISTEHKKEILRAYRNIPVLYIPALMEENGSSEKDKNYMPEPFKISALDKSLRELYEKKYHGKI